MAFSFTDDSDMYMEQDGPAKRQVADNQPQENRDLFYPSFHPFQTQPSGHSRPFYPQQEGAYSHRPQGAYEQRFDYDTAKYVGYKDRENQAASENVGVLGSGNFGVIKGGTFYHENEAAESSNFEDDYSPYYGNGHGRPSFYYNQNPRPYQHEQFANFRDFADINTPSYSQYIVVYANKNGTTEEPPVVKRRPNNIFESLAQLELTSDDNVVTEVVPKKMSKSKRKLALVPKEKKVRIKKTDILKRKAQNDASEPLLALS
ncbi:hypothetical protein HHI36_016352 [Cryptolaemus montrouzieri]|uniref:Uncharacterized protein n=1 Tax=Cryptolaemus montrouzieri TaxID=559131 RepID=A0ABD2NK96_9CUCU